MSEQDEDDGPTREATPSGETSTEAESEEPSKRFRIVVALMIAVVSVLGAGVAYTASNTANHASDLDQNAQEEYLFQQQIKTSARASVGEDLRRVADLQEQVLAAHVLRQQAARYRSTSPQVAGILESQAQGDDALARTTAASFFAESPQIGTDGTVHYDAKQALTNLLSNYVIYQQLHPAQTQAEANDAVLKYRKTVAVGVLFVAALFFLTLAEFGRRRIRQTVVVIGAVAAVVGVVLWPLVEAGTV